MARDQAYFKCVFFSGDRPGDLGRVKVPDILRVPNDDGILFNMHSIPSGTIRKKFLLCKSTKKARYVRSLGKKPHFWPPQRLKKVLLTAQGCARLLTGPIIMQIPRGYQKKKFIM